jgi:hypothetical protein
VRFRYVGTRLNLTYDGDQIWTSEDRARKQNGASFWSDIPAVRSQHRLVAREMTRRQLGRRYRFVSVSDAVVAPWDAVWPLHKQLRCLFVNASLAKDLL